MVKNIKLGDEICRNNYINHYRVIGLNSKLKLQEICIKNGFEEYCIIEEFDWNKVVVRPMF
jgi:hypothetical protein